MFGTVYLLGKINYLKKKLFNKKKASWEKIPQVGENNIYCEINISKVAIFN